MIEPLRFLERTSTSGKSPEASLLLLHGIGSNERDLLLSASCLGDRLDVLSLRAPLNAGLDRFMWYPLLNGGRGPAIDYQAAVLARDALVGTIRQHKALHPGRPVYLLGFSQGAALSLITALTMPGEIEGAMCFSGRFPQEFQSSLSSPASLASTNIWVSHGRVDMTIPIDYGREVQSLLEWLEVRHSYREYPAGHEITPAMMTDARLWLDRQLEFKPQIDLPATIETSPQT